MRPRRRRRHFERLESRRLLAAYINEVLFDPLFGNPDTDQYIELRGAPNASLADGTYLAIVDSSRTSATAGEIQGIFDLSGLAFGSNGFLVLLPQDSPFTPDPRANTLRSTSLGFGGLPGDIFSDAHDLSDRLDFIYDSNSLFLFQSDVPPQLGDDIDADNDGYRDPSSVFDNWDVLDSVSTLWSLGDGNGYGQIVFINRMGHNPAVILAEGATLVELEGTGYIGRIGNSTGWAAEDWVGGVVKDMADDDLFMRLAGDVHGRPRPIVFHGRELDSVGSENFTGAVRLSSFRDADADGVQDQDDTPLEGAVFLADTNGNGLRDLLTTVIEPDDFLEGVEMNNLTPGVTLSTTVEGNVVSGFDIQPAQQFGAPEGTHNLSHAGVDFFNTDRRLRLDFYRPAQSVSVDVIGTSNTTPTYGRLEVFDADGNSLRMIRTGPLGENQRRTMTINMGSDRIAYAIAYGDNEHMDSSPFGKLDTISFSVPEAIATTDADGRATLNYLDPGNYLIAPFASGGLGGDYLLDPVPIRITKYENFDLTLGAQLNHPPVIETSELAVPESASGGSIVGTVIATDAPGQEVRFTLVEGSDRFTIDATTGQVRVKAGAVLDHETAGELEITVRATDDAPNPLSSQATIRITVLDVNEPPLMGNVRFEVTENPAAGTVLGSLVATDPDAGASGLAGYRIVGNNPGGALAIDSETGELTVANPDAFDYEAQTTFTVAVEAYDGGSPALATTRAVTIDLLDHNEAPRILTTEIAVGELAPSGTIAGRIQSEDPDAFQTVTFRWADGFTTDLFTLNALTGDVAVAPGATLDYATAPEHSLEITVEDSGLPTQKTTGTVRIRIVDENNPPEIESAALSVPENSAAGTVVGTVAAADPDAGSVITFAIIGGSGADRFTIDPSRGEVQVAESAELDFETASEWEIEVQASDNGQPIASSTRTLTVTVTDQNEPPTVQPTELTVAENAAPGTEIGSVLFGDQDAGDTTTIALVESEDAALFTIDPETGVLSVGAEAEFDFETRDHYTLLVRVQDGHHPPIEAEIQIAVTDANDAPAAVGSLDPVDVVAGLPLEVVLGADLFADVDAGQGLSLTILGAGGELPQWLSFDPLTGQLTGLPWNLDVGEHALTLVCTDNGTPPLAAEIEFMIRVVANAAPWHNPASAEDVNGDGRIQPLDALAIINYLNRAPSNEVAWDTRERPNFLDVNANNRIEPIDALRIINYLNRQTNPGGESPASDVDNVAAIALPPWIEEEEQQRRRASVQDEALLEFLG